MSSHLGVENTEGMCGSAQSYAVGSATQAEREAFEQHLLGCSACQSEVESATETLAQVAQPASMSPEARERFISRLRDVKGNGSGPSSEIVFALPGLLATRPENMKWQSAGVDGVWIKTLFEDASRNYRTSLVRLESGVHYPAHRHAGVEEAYVLEGDLHFDSGTLVAGDYCRAESGSIHSSSYTKNGCVLLITASTADELLPAHS